MISFHAAELIFSTIISLISYYLSINISGIIQSWINSKLGDNTAIEKGYDKFDPLLYLSILNIAFLFILRLPLPLNPPVSLSKFSGRYRSLKLFILYLSQYLINLFLAILALSLASLIYVNNYKDAYNAVLTMFGLTTELLFSSKLSMVNQKLSCSGFSLSILYLFSYFIYHNILLALYGLILNAVKYILETIKNNFLNSTQEQYFAYVNIILNFLIFYLFGKNLYVFIFNTVIFGAVKIIHYIYLLKYML